MKRTTGPTSILAPLRTPLFRRIWIASMISNLGAMFLSVGAAWQMTLLTPRAEMVALVQTALVMPMMILAVPAGAVVDMYDRRRLAMAALCIAFSAAVTLAVLTLLGRTSSTTILICCFMIGTGMAFFYPAWQSSVSEQVPRETLPQAVSLNAISFNIARSFGPALGGVVVAVAGVVVAFFTTAVAYLPMLISIYLWRRQVVPARLPPERIDRAVGGGIRYIVHSPQIRTVVIRSFVMGFGGGSVSALMPLVARDLLGGRAEIFGILLGCYGIGAVIGAFSLTRLRHRLSEEATISLAAVVLASAIGIVAASRSAPLTGIALIIGGTGWMIGLTLFNVLVQTSSPRWVSGRLLAGYQTAIAGGIALGSWFWGSLAQRLDVQHALAGSALLLALSVLLGIPLRMPRIVEADQEPVRFQDPEVNLDITGRSGPIVLELEYCVPSDSARAFYGQMLAVRSIRARNGAFGWSIARDIMNPEIWVERYHCATWNDYLRQRDRRTPNDMRIHEQAQRLMREGYVPSVRRLLERPIGSVRWADASLEG